MSKTKEDYARINAKMTGIKGTISRSCDTLRKRCIQLDEMLKRESKEFPNKTTNRLADEINKAKLSIDANLINLNDTGNTLTKVISGMKAEDTKEKDLKKMADKVMEDINDYISKYEQSKMEHTHTIKAADKMISTTEAPKYQKRMELLEAKKENENHSEYLTHLEKVMSRADFKNMTSDELIIYVFTRNADSTMSKLGIEILTNDKPTVTKLKSRIKETELEKQKRGEPN